MIELLLPLGVPALVGAFMLLRLALGDRRNGRARVERWLMLAVAHGWRDITSGVTTLGDPSLTARAGRHRIHFGRRTRGKYALFTEVTVEGNSGVTLRPEPPTNLVTQGLREREVELGDETFDAAVEVHGAPERVRALLDAETRGIVLRMLSGLLAPPGRPSVLLRGSVSLVDGNLQAVFVEPPAPPPGQELEAALDALLALADRFQRPVDLAARLAATIESEPLWRVRLQGLQLLAVSFPNDPATASALRSALADERDEVRLLAGATLAEEGTASLLEIARREQVDDSTAAQAIDALGDRLPTADATTILQQSLRLRHLQAAHACIDALGGRGGTEGTELLVKVLSRESGPLPVAAARALGRRRAGDAEAALVGALARDQPDLTAAAIAALGHTGSVRAVLPIQEAARRLDSDTEVRRAARQAVAEIQSRLPGASPGQLSLAASEGGEVSLADEDPRGRLSLPAAPHER